jgi:hypothetical protein
MFEKVISLKGELSGKASEKWELMDKIQRAAPGTIIGKHIALVPEITRGELSVLLMEELQVQKIFQKFDVPQSSNSFFPPSGESVIEKKGKISEPGDIKDHWARPWIVEIIDMGILSPFPGGDFHPQERITKINYAEAILNILIRVSKDKSLSTKYLGEVPSRFPDLSSSHYAYSAAAICVERGILSVDKTTGAFGPEDTVSGADALLIIRELQNQLRITF